MHSGRQVLSALRSYYAEQELAPVAGRLLRVPEAWRALHNPVFLDEVLAASPPPHLTASHLAALALGGTINDRIDASLAEPHRGRAQQLWENARAASGQRRDLLETALVGLQFAGRIEDDPSLVERIVENPSTWRSPLAVAWPALREPEALLAALLETGAHSLATQIVMSNLAAEEAASYLVRNANGSTIPMLLEIWHSGELELAQSMSLPKVSKGSHADGLAPLVLQAVGSQSRGEPDAARAVLDQAWESAAQTTAYVADFTAELARAEGDAVTELEANRRGLDTVPSGARRARTALCLSRMGRGGEAAAMLRAADPSIEERIALGSIQIGEHNPQAADTLRQVATELIETGARMEHEGYLLLTDGLRRCGEPETAIQVGQAQLIAQPANSSAHLLLAEMLSEAGDWEAAARHADLAVGLAPESQEARQLLATALETAGDFAAALGHRRQIADGNAKALAKTAIRAGELDFAGAVVEQMLTDDGHSVEAHLALGQILSAQGEGASAKAAFEEALRYGPQHPEAHLAMADWQRSNGEMQAAGQTLMQAAQFAPADPAIQVELADWLEASGRASEAVDAAAEAVRLAPKMIGYRLRHARLLTELGQTDQALDDLTEAATQAPRDWRLRVAMAEIHEREGHLHRAAAQLQTMPKGAGAQEWLIAGRIGVQVGQNLPAALQALSTAEENGADDPALHYWYALGSEQAGDYETAIDRYGKALQQLDMQQFQLREQATLGSARCELRQGRIAGALEILDQARQAFGGGSRILALTAQVYRSAQLHDKAIETAQAAVEADEDDPSGWEALSGSLAAVGDFDGALAAAEQHGKLDPDSIEPWLQIAELAAEAGQKSLSRQSLARAIWQGRKDATKLAHAATALSKLGSPGAAMRTMRHAVRKGSADPELQRAQAELLEECGAYQPAQQAWIEYAGQVPADEQPLRNAAACAERLGRSHEVIQLLERAQTVNPKSPGLRRQLAGAYMRQGSITRGIRAYSSALRESPNDVSLAMEAAEAALLAGAAREALGFAGRAQQLAADDGRLQAALGEGYLLLNEPEKAAGALDKAIALGASSPRIVAMLSTLRPESPDSRKAVDQAVPESAHDAVWLARAHMHALDFDRARQVLADWSHEPTAAIELARTELRARDAQWILGYADLEPAAQADRSSNAAPEVVKQLQTKQIEAAMVEPIQAWSAAEQQPKALQAHAAADGTGQLGEALVVALLRSGRPERALEAIRDQQPAASAATWLSVLEGIAHERSGHQEQARAAFRKVTEANPLRPVAEYLTGRSYAAVSSYQRAVRHMGKAASRWMHEPSWQYELGNLYLEMEDPDSALGHFQSAAGSAPEQAEYQLALAKAYQACGHLMQAEAAISAALEDESAGEEAVRLGGEVALRIGRPELAAKRFERACDMAPDDALAQIGAANAAAALGNRHEAESHLRSALALEPERAEVLLGQGQVLMQTGKSVAAMEAFGLALQVGADPAQVHRMQGRLLLEQGNGEQAVGALRKALEVDSEDDATWHQLATALENQGELTAADEAVGHALRISPRNPEYRLTLAQISRRSGNLDRAVEELRQARSVVPNDPRLAVEIGLVHEDRREYSRALDAYREAIEVDPRCLDAYFRAGMLLRTLKAYRKAGEMLKHAAELAPINKDVLHQLAAVRALELVHG